MVCFPEKGDLEILERILAGGLSKMIEAGCTVIGGHSIRDDETKFGYSVTGLIDPARVLTNSGAKPGDRLLLTKALGTGVISTAIKKGTAKQSWIDAAVKSMTTLNKDATEVIAGKGVVSRSSLVDSSVLQNSAPVLPVAKGELQTANDRRPAADDAFSVHALTDVTGFGLIGHAREMALASNVGLRLDSAKVPILEGAIDCIRAGFIPGGLKANREFAECVVGYAESVPEEMRTLLFDPQTAGGLLISVARDHAGPLLSALIAAGVPAVDVGEVVQATKPVIAVR